jgi:ABC-type tungstate transport system permease subunit
MHSGDITTDLVADGYGINMKPWTRNDLSLYGPPSDPAHIKGLKSGAEAFRRIAETQSPFLDALDAGSREVSHKIRGLKGQIKAEDCLRLYIHRAGRSIELALKTNREGFRNLF